MRRELSFLFVPLVAPAVSPSRPRMATLPTHATSAQLAASIMFLLSADSTNVNGAILASDGGWSAL